VRLPAAIMAALVLSLAGTVPARAQYIMDIGNLTIALRTGELPGVAAALSSGVTTVYVARLTGIAGARINGPTLDRAIANRSRSLRHLRAVVRQSREAMKALDRHGQTLDQVIHVTVTSDRTATLYVDDR
jgi:hypothetical protein